MFELKRVFREIAPLISNNAPDKVLEKLLWIHDNPDPLNPMTEIYRRANGFLALATLATTYDPAKEAIRNLIETKKSMIANGDSSDPIKADLAALEDACQTMELAL